MAGLINGRLLCYSTDVECLVEWNLFKHFARWEPTQWPNMKRPGEKRNEIYENLFRAGTAEIKSEKSSRWEHRITSCLIYVNLNKAFRINFFRGASRGEWSRSRAALIYAPFVWNRSYFLELHYLLCFRRSRYADSARISTISFKLRIFSSPTTSFLFFAFTRPFEVRRERYNSGLENKMADIKVYCCLTLMVFSKSNACLGYSFDWNVSRVGNKMEIQKTFSNLNSGFGQVDFKCYFFTHKNIWISSFAEQRFENVKLGSGERRPLSSLLSWVNACKRWTKRKSLLSAK